MRSERRYTSVLSGLEDLLFTLREVGKMLEDFGQKSEHYDLCFERSL